jgi:sec-independent protein translocase protein TatC
VRIGEYGEAGALAEKSLPALRNAPSEALPGMAGAPEPELEIKARLEGLGRLVDSATLGASDSARPVLKQVLALRMDAVTAMLAGRQEIAAGKAEEAAGRLAAISPEDAGQLSAVWRLEKELSRRRTQLDAENWTRPMLTMSEQLTLVLILELALGIIFELPLVMALLALVGMVKSSWLFKYQRHAIVLCLFLAAVITPTGDAVNLALLAGPMMLCYEVGVVAVWLIERRRKNSEPDGALALRE